MTPEIEPQRRALLIIYRRYLLADRAWRLAQREAQSWFPSHERPAVPIGNPGSRIRRLHDRRDRAVEQLEVALLKLHEAQRRAAARTMVLSLPPVTDRNTRGGLMTVYRLGH